jgi:hypothetical protein
MNWVVNDFNAISWALVSGQYFKKLFCIHIFDGAGTNWLKTWRPIVLLQEREVWNISLKIFVFLVNRQKCPFYGRKRVHDNSVCLPGYQAVTVKAYHKYCWKFSIYWSNKMRKKDKELIFASLEFLKYTFIETVTKLKS